MNKYNPGGIIISLVLVFSLLLSACSSSDNPDAEPGYLQSEGHIKMIIRRILTLLEVGPLVNDNKNPDMPVEIMRVTAEPDADMPVQPDFGTVEDVGDIQQTDFSVLVYAGNPATFSTPPTVYYANAGEYPSAPGGVVSYSAEIPLPFATYFSVRGRGSWMQLESTGPVTAMGVMLWGDHQDGMVEVYLDDTLIWTGDTYFENCNFETSVCEGAFDYYVEASELEPGIHRIRVVNVTDDMEATVWYFGIGKVNP